MRADRPTKQTLLSQKEPTAARLDQILCRNTLSIEGFRINISLGDDQFSRCTRSGDTVKEAQEHNEVTWKAERLEKGETWTFDGTNLIHQEREHGGLQTSTYTDSDGDGIFTAISGGGDSFGL